MSIVGADQHQQKARNGNENETSGRLEAGGSTVSQPLDRLVVHRVCQPDHAVEPEQVVVPVARCHGSAPGEKGLTTWMDGTSWYSSHETRIAIPLFPSTPRFSRSGHGLPLPRKSEQTDQDDKCSPGKEQRAQTCHGDGCIKHHQSGRGLVSHARESRNHTLDPCLQMSSN